MFWETSRIIFDHFDQISGYDGLAQLTHKSNYHLNIKCSCQKLNLNPIGPLEWMTFFFFLQEIWEKKEYDKSENKMQKWLGFFTLSVVLKERRKERGRVEEGKRKRGIKTRRKRERGRWRKNKRKKKRKERKRTKDGGLLYTKRNLRGIITKCDVVNLFGSYLNKSIVKISFETIGGIYVWNRNF